MQNVKRDLSMFVSQQALIASTPHSYNANYDTHPRKRVKQYTIKEIEDILNSGSIDSMRALSRDYYERDGFYTRLIMHYATVLSYYGVLVPNPKGKQPLTLPHLSKRYRQALEYIDKINLQDLFTRLSIRVLLDGCYYGVLVTLDKNNLTVLDLPGCYCRSRFKDIHGKDLIEFDVTYFYTILDKEARAQALSIYPEEVQTHFNNYKNGRTAYKWVMIPSEMSLCFSFSDDNVPPFVGSLPSILQYEQAVDKELEREDEEIRKIIVQKVPHLTSTGELVFETDEALEMHKGAVNMLSGNKNLSVLTTYADVEAIGSKTSADTVTSALEQMRQNIYSNTGVSSQLFAPTGSQSLLISIKNDMALMMVVANKYANFTSWILNTLFGNSNISFTYKILPVGIYNQNEYVDEALKMAQNGYSSLLPAAAMGVSQLDLVNLKTVENDVLDLNSILIPLNTSYTQSGSNSDSEGGRPTIPEDQKAQQTIDNENAKENQGGM